MIVHSTQIIAKNLFNYQVSILSFYITELDFRLLNVLSLLSIWASSSKC